MSGGEAATRPGARRRRVIVVGGGLAGMAAAVALEAAGAAVTLLEARQSLGGRAGSFRRPADRRRAGQLPARAARVLHQPARLLPAGWASGTDPIRARRSFRRSRGPAVRLCGTRGLPAPLHLGPSLLRFGGADLGGARGAVAGDAGDAAARARGRLALADVPFGQWLDEHRQPASLIHKLYEPILVGALNEDAAAGQRRYAIQVFQEALLANAGGYVLGLPACPLGQLYERLPCRDVRLGARVAEVRLRGQRAIAACGLQAAKSWRRTRWCWRRIITRCSGGCRRSCGGRTSGSRGSGQLEACRSWGHTCGSIGQCCGIPRRRFIEGPLQWLFRKDAEGRKRTWRHQCRPGMGGPAARGMPGAVRAAGSADVPGGAGRRSWCAATIVIEKRATFPPVPGVDRPPTRQGAAAGGHREPVSGRGLHADGVAGDDGRGGAERVPGRRSGDRSWVCERMGRGDSWCPIYRWSGPSNFWSWRQVGIVRNVRRPCSTMVRSPSEWD